MLNLHAPTPERWFTQVENNIDLLLIDHAHCEKKAAGVAMNLLFAYVDEVELARAMTVIVQEELGLSEENFPNPWRSTLSATVSTATGAEMTLVGIFEAAITYGLGLAFARR